MLLNITDPGSRTPNPVPLAFHPESSIGFSFLIQDPESSIGFSFTSLESLVSGFNESR
jgi:hypothetical protein